MAWLLSVFGFTWKKTIFFCIFGLTLTPIYPLKVTEKHSIFIDIGDDIYNSEIQITHFHSNTGTVNNCNPVIICQVKSKWIFGNNLYIHSFFISMVYFLLSLSLHRRKPFSASKYAKDVLACRQETPYCFVQQTTALHENRRKCCSMEILNVLTCQKTYEQIWSMYIFTKTLLLVDSCLFFFPSLSCLNKCSCFK